MFRRDRKLKKSIARKAGLTVLSLILVVAGVGMKPMAIQAAPCTGSGHNVTISSACEFAAGTYTYTGTFTIENGVTVTAQGDTGGGTGVIIEAEDIVIEGTLSADEQGYDWQDGPGKGTNYNGAAGGGAHGGDGGQSGDLADSGGSAYGSVREPLTLGSGGGKYAFNATQTGSGGGAIKLVASSTGTIIVNGVITADGEASASFHGGGAGGSIWLDAASIQGTGAITATGGAGGGDGGGGGGGRVSINYTSSASSTFADGSAVSVEGGVPVQNPGHSGGAGTVYVSDGSGSGDLIVDNSDITRTGTTSTTPFLETADTFDNITISSGAKYVVASGRTLTLSATGTLTGGGTNQASLQVASGATFDSSGTTFTIDDVDFDLDGTLATATTLTISDTDFDHDGALSATVTQINFAASTGTTYFRNNGTGFNDLTLQVENNGIFVSESVSYDNLTSLTVKSTGTFRQAHTSTLDITTVTVESGGTIDHADNSTAQSYVVDISATDIDIQSGGAVDADSLGYDLQQGPGAGADYNGAAGGGAHGGDGGQSGDGPAAGGEGYDDLREPTILGSGGGKYAFSGISGGSGGGAIKLVVTGTLQVNGTITADGAAGGSFHGGGAGGSVWLDAPSIQGSGAITATGGAGGGDGGGGGGGRVSINYTSSASSTFVDGSVASAEGGVPTQSPGHSGGAGTVYVSDGSGSGDVIVDNNDITRTGTTSTTPLIGSADTFDNLTISSGAKYQVASGQTLTLSATGTFTGGGTNQASIQVSSGATFNPSVTSFTFDDVDVDLDGTIATVTTLTLSDTDFDHDGALSATVTQINFAASTGTTYFRNNGSGFNDLTLQVENNGIFVSESTSYDNLTSLTIKNTGTFEQSHATTVTIGTVTVESGGTLAHSNNSTTKQYVVDIAATTIDIQSGGTVDADGLGYDLTEGDGQGGDSNGPAGGAGYGGAGGAGTGSGATGGPTYGSATAPSDLGSGGGKYNFGGANGGQGGGAVKLVASGTFTIDGTITSDGNNAGSFHGGGSGGSVWLQASTLEGACSNISATGGNGTGSGAGGAGGGRVYLTYDTKTCTGDPVVSGGSGAGSGASGSVGTFEEATLTQPIAVNGITVSPSSPGVTDNVTISASATYESGLDYVELFLDGTTPSNSLKNCSSGTATNTTCTYESGPLSSGTHTAYAVAHGDDYTSATSTLQFVVSENTSQNSYTVERHKAGETTSFALSFTLPYAQSSSLTVTFPASFTISGAFTTGSCGSGTISNFAFDNTAKTLTADKSSCNGAVSLSGATITLPGTAGLYEVTWVNDSPGSVIIPVTDDDQVTVSADVASELTFDLDISTSDSDTDAPYTLAIGNLGGGSPNGSDDSSVSGIWVDLDTNATGGAVVQVQSTNASLASASAPGDTIPSSSGDVNGGTTARYGLCVATAGSGVPAATVGTFQSVAPFSGATGGALGCTTTNASVGALTTSFQTILNTNSNPIDGGRAQIRVKVDISDATVGHDDYSDTLTFRATSTF